MKKILVVDDDPDILELLRGRLEKNHFEVMTAPNAVRALAKVMEMKPDLITLDIMMPGVFGMDKFGASLCETLKNDPQYNVIPILIISGVQRHSSPEIDDMVKKAEHYFSKPFDSHEVIDKINQIFSKN
jgi:CheY-like chemotaxis protein